MVSTDQILTLEDIKSLLPFAVHTVSECRSKGSWGKGREKQWHASGLQTHPLGENSPAPGRMAGAEARYITF